jgi:integrase
MRSPVAGMSPGGTRKYLNAAERPRSIKAAGRTKPEVRLFCLVLGCSGSRSSETLTLTPAAIDLNERAVILDPSRRIVQQVPLPRAVIADLNKLFDLPSGSTAPSKVSAGPGAL